MALVASQSSNSTASETQALEFALSDFSSILTDDERKRLQQMKQVPDASAAIVFTAQLDAANSARRGKSIGARAYSMLQSFQQFSIIVDTFVSANPNIAALVWGSIKVTVLIASNVTSYFESLADLFMSLNKYFPEYDQYQLLFPNSPILRKAICIFHASVVKLCKEAILLKREGWVKHITNDLSSKLRPQIDGIQICSKDVKNAISLAKATYDRKEQESQEEHRNNVSSWMSRSQKDSEKTSQWQLRKDEAASSKFGKACADRLLTTPGKHKMELLNLLSTYKHQENYIQTRKKRHVDTATWLFQTPEFTQWNSNETSSLFLLTGKLGSGKTVLASSVVDHISCQRKFDESIAYVFPRFDDPASINATTILRSIIRQSLQADDVIGEIEKQISCIESYTPETSEIEKLLQLCILCIGRFAKFYIVIDSLDELEYDERNILLQSLSSLVSTHNSKAKLFLASRMSISGQILKRFPAVHQSHTKGNGIQADIAKYTEEMIRDRQGKHVDSDERLIIQDPKLAQEIIEKLTKGADGMFLWVNYQIAEISECTCDDEIRQALTALPKTLGETFDRAAKRIIKRGTAKAKIAGHIFQWVAAAKRALTLDELREAFSFRPGTPYPIVGKRPNGMERLTAWCENLVQLDEELQIVQFAHHSVLQHFLSESIDTSLQIFHIDLKKADHYIGEICLTYLDSNEFRTDLIKKPGAIPYQLPGYIVERGSNDKASLSRKISKAAQIATARFRNRAVNTNNHILIEHSREDPMTAFQLSHPFLIYASAYWLLHTRTFAKDESITWDLWAELIRGGHKLATTPWTLEEFRPRHSLVHDWIDKHDHYTLFSHLLLDTYRNEEEQSKIVLRYTKHNSVPYISILVKRLRNKHVFSPALAYAARIGNEEMVQYLLKAEPDLEALCDLEPNVLMQRTALQFASNIGNPNIVNMLLGAGADVNALGSSGETALQLAAQSRSRKVVRILLDAGADVNVKNNAGTTALQIAVKQGFSIELDIVGMLLDAGVDVKAVNNYGETVLHAAIRYNQTGSQNRVELGSSKVIQMLVDAGANINAKNKKGDTILHVIAESQKYFDDYPEIIKMLLDRHADLNSTTNSGATALQLAARNGYSEIVRILLAARADARASNEQGETALHLVLDLIAEDLEKQKKSRHRFAVENTNDIKNGTEIVKMLLEWGANVNAKTNSGKGILDFPTQFTYLQGGHSDSIEKIIHMLLDAMEKVKSERKVLKVSIDLNQPEWI